jgi:hypothetical protein
MIYYVFSTEAEALSTEQQIVDNVQSWLVANIPDALSTNGDKLRGRNAQTDKFVDVYTVRWAIPQQITDGRWVFSKPTAGKVAPIPVDVFISNITAIEEEYSQFWFDSNIGVNS